MSQWDFYMAEWSIAVHTRCIEPKAYGIRFHNTPHPSFCLAQLCNMADWVKKHPRTLITSGT